MSLATLIANLGISTPSSPSPPTSSASTSSSSTSAFTESVATAAGPNANPRLATVVAGLVRHLHAFARDVNLTHDEWMAGVDFINRAGLLSTVRNEAQLICDVLGLESLVDKLENETTTTTSSAILGPFYKPSPPVRASGTSIASAQTNKTHADATTRIRGRVLCAVTNTPIPNAVVDIWHADPDGLYEGQDGTSAHEPGELRGVYSTNERGEYDIYCLRPGPYPLPDDGPVGELLGLLDRPIWRPAHIHFKVSAEGFCPLTTQLFDEDDGHLESDTVFAVKEDLMVKFEEGGEGARYAVYYDFRLRASS